MIIKKLVKKLGDKTEAPSVEVWVDHTPLGRLAAQSALQTQAQNGAAAALGSRVALKRKPLVRPGDDSGL